MTQPAWKKQRPAQWRPALERLEDRLQPAVLVPALDGTGNNLANPDWGSTDTNLLRLAPADYADGSAAPAGEDRPSARDISNLLAAHIEGDLKNDRSLSALIYAWGQFIDHDIDLTVTADPAESFPIPVPTGDPFFDPSGTGTQTMPLSRSDFDPATGTSAENPRQQVNSITAFLDGSMIYGSAPETAASLRTFAGGMLKTSAGNLLPVGEDGSSFAAGDIRANENIELTSLQTLFVREHNRLAAQIAARNPNLTDEQIFQQARRLVVAELQVITYNEFLPALLGRNALDPYTGYDPTVNPGIANEFSTAAFRVGHTMLGNDVEFLDNNGEEIRDPVALHEAFFNPDLLRETGIDSVLKYLASDLAEEIDPQVVDSVRNFLFGPPGAGGLDLASLNIQRGRDHGLADYNTTRAAYGLERVTDFAQITSDPEVQQKLRDLYGSVDNIDLWVGGLAEDHVPGGSVGATFTAIIADQFERLRDGDRFWYQNQFAGKELAQIQKTTLADVIRRNTAVTNLQDNVFFFRTEITGQVFQDLDRDGRLDRGERGVAGRTLELLDESNAVVATATTGRDGSYRFTDVGLGTYQVREVLPANVQGTTANLQTVTVTRGGTIDHVDFGEAQPRQQTPRPTPAPRPHQSALSSGQLIDAVDVVFTELGRLRNGRQ